MFLCLYLHRVSVTIVVSTSVTDLYIVPNGDTVAIARVCDQDK
jgi:hypothetical protein